MKKYFLVLKEFLQLSVQQLFEYRADFITWAFVSFGWTLFSITFYEVIFTQTNNIAGWSKPDVFLLVGTYLIIDSATWSIFWQNIQTYVEAIFEGTLDYLLLQPIDVQFRLSTRYFRYTNIMRLLIGVYLVVTNVHGHVSPIQIALYLFYVFIALMIVYSLWFFTATFTFWAGRLKNITEIVPVLRSLWSTPADVFTGPIATIFTIIIPLALISTVPVRFLLGTQRPREVIILTVFAVTLLIVTRVFFKFAIKRYSSAGS